MIPGPIRQGDGASGFGSEYTKILPISSYQTTGWQTVNRMRFFLNHVVLTLLPKVSYLAIFFTLLKEEGKYSLLKSQLLKKIFFLWITLCISV